MPIFELDGDRPRFADPTHTGVAPGAQMIGNVVLGFDASVWFNAVVRADNDQIPIGDRVQSGRSSMMPPSARKA